MSLGLKNGNAADVNLKKFLPLIIDFIPNSMKCPLIKKIYPSNTLKGCRKKWYKAPRKTPRDTPEPGCTKISTATGAQEIKNRMKTRNDAFMTCSSSFKASRRLSSLSGGTTTPGLGSI
uniref:Uncharacterized protein n=1 Tax=Romanomermis culicivorax TaxID=13658 RepID=A0A915KBJ5_ROMCU